MGSRRDLYVLSGTVKELVSEDGRMTATRLTDVLGSGTEFVLVVCMG